MAHHEISDSRYPNTASGIKIYIKNAAGLLKPKKRAGTETVDREMLEAH